MESTCLQKYSENKLSLLWHKFFFPRLGTSTEPLVIFQTIKFCQLCRKLHSTYQKPFDENSSFQKLKIVLSYQDFEWKISWLLAGKLRQGFWNCTCVSRLRLVNFLKIVQNFFVFLYTNWFIFNFARFFSAGFPQLSSTCQRIFFRKNFWFQKFFQFFQRFRIWGKFLGLLATTIRQCCQNCIPCASGTNWGKCCSKSL